MHYLRKRQFTAQEAVDSLERKAQAKEAMMHEWTTKLAEITTYELLFELVKRIKGGKALETVGPTQLIVVGRACFEELGRRVQKSVRDSKLEKKVLEIFK